MNFPHFCEFWCFSLGKQARKVYRTFVPECPCEKFMNRPFFGLVCRGHFWSEKFNAGMKAFRAQASQNRSFVSEQLSCGSAEWKFSPFFSAKGVVKLGVKVWWNFSCATFSRVWVSEAENFTKISFQKQCEKREISHKVQSAGAWHWFVWEWENAEKKGHKNKCSRPGIFWRLCYVFLSPVRNDPKRNINKCSPPTQSREYPPSLFRYAYVWFLSLIYFYYIRDQKKKPHVRNFPPTILGPAMAAPFFWTPGIFRSFCRKTSMSIKFLILGGGGAEVPILFLWQGDFSEKMNETEIWLIAGIPLLPWFPGNFRDSVEFGRIREIFGKFRENSVEFSGIQYGA